MVPFARHASRAFYLRVGISPVFLLHAGGAALRRSPFEGDVDGGDLPYADLACVPERLTNRSTSRRWAPTKSRQTNSTR